MSGVPTSRDDRLCKLRAIYIYNISNTALALSLHALDMLAVPLDIVVIVGGGEALVEPVRQTVLVLGGQQLLTYALPLTLPLIQNGTMN